MDSFRPMSLSIDAEKLERAGFKNVRATINGKIVFVSGDMPFSEGEENLLERKAINRLYRLIGEDDANLLIDRMYRTVERTIMLSILTK